jgi:DEAD/DEAH box helicase
MSIVPSGAAFVWCIAVLLFFANIALAVPPAAATATAAAFTSVPIKTRRSSTVCTVGHNRQRVITTMDDDDFYDDVDLSNFDVDAVIAAHQKAASSSSNKAVVPASASVATATAVTSSSSDAAVAPAALDDKEATLSSPSKRRKVSVSPPHISSSTSHAANTDTATTSSTSNSLQKTLQDTFGYPDFRPGQLSVLQHLIFEQKDVAVYWATGQGKSLCYQIPALHLNQIVIVVSPLISLMQDQCHKLNGLGLVLNGDGGGGEQNIAAFLGSAQTDAAVERDALQGKFNILYVTPEKMTQGNFLDQLGRLHSSPSARRKICLIAVDEAHCVRYVKVYMLDACFGDRVC